MSEAEMITRPMNEMDLFMNDVAAMAGFPISLVLGADKEWWDIADAGEPYYAHVNRVQEALLAPSRRRLMRLWLHISRLRKPKKYRRILRWKRMQ